MDGRNYLYSKHSAELLYELGQKTIAFDNWTKLSERLCVTADALKQARGQRKQRPEVWPKTIRIEIMTLPNGTRLPIRVPHDSSDSSREVLFRDVYFYNLRQIYIARRQDDPVAFLLEAREFLNTHGLRIEGIDELFTSMEGLANHESRQLETIDALFDRLVVILKRAFRGENPPPEPAQDISPAPATAVHSALLTPATGLEDGNAVAASGSSTDPLVTCDMADLLRWVAAQQHNSSQAVAIFVFPTSA